MNGAAKQICFVDMPFGKKQDPKSRVEIDFDQIYEQGIEPAITAQGLKPVRGDREETGGIIHTAMFARLLLAEFVIADMTTANPNVFYELGVRHAAKPYTTIPLFATIGAPPFDVNMVRAIPYDLTDGALSKASAQALVQNIGKRIRRALEGPVANDSPLFDLFDEFPGIEMSHELTDVFRDRVDYSIRVKNELATARQVKPQEKALEEIKVIVGKLGEPKLLESGVLIDTYLSYRAVSAWNAMIELYEQMPAHVQQTALARQQLALALNRRNQMGDRDRAVQVLTQLIRDYGENAETLGILGRVYKDQYTEAKKAQDLAAEGWLDLAIETYTKGFEAEPADYYPGVNAVTLLLQKGDEQSLSEVDRLAPLVTFAAVRQGGERANDYWTVVTVLELACANRDYPLAQRCLPRALALGKEDWMFDTTAANLRLIEQLRSEEDDIAIVGQIASKLEAAANALRGEKA
jgi:tetratricopeptide (TPR) repeat protein